MAELTELDLNLLVVLDVLLQERSVTRAARRLGRTQSTVSHSLARLRELLGDPLLLRDGRGMVPSPRAEALRQPLSRLLLQLAHLLDDGGRFEPSESERTFVLLCPDNLAPLFGELWRRLHDEAPGVCLEIRPLPSGDLEAALTGGQGDLALGAVPRAGGVDLVVRRLGGLDWAVAARRGHPVLETPWSTESWARWPHVQVRTGTPGPSLVERAAAAQGLERRVGMVVGSFLAASRVAAQTELLFHAPRAVLELLAEDLGLHVLPVPFELPAASVGALWSRRLEADPAQRWLRERVVSVVGERLGAASG